jgi:hypothetical protein
MFSDCISSIFVCCVNLRFIRLGSSDLRHNEPANQALFKSQSINLQTLSSMRSNHELVPLSNLTDGSQTIRRMLEIVWTARLGLPPSRFVPIESGTTRTIGLAPDLTYYRIPYLEYKRVSYTGFVGNSLPLEKYKEWAEPLFSIAAFH